MRDDPNAGPHYVSIGVAQCAQPQEAVRTALSRIPSEKTCFILAFIPASLDVEETVEALNRYGDGVPVFGCTTAGQITPNGYENDALLLLAFPKNNFRCASVLFNALTPFSETGIALKARQDNTHFRHTAGWHRLGLIFSDGVSAQEDVLISTLEAVLDNVPIFGGSAGDGLRFQETFVLHKGRAFKNAAVLLLIETNLQFQGIGFDHFLPKNEPLVITAADPDTRCVYEINGSPAALEYARLVGCDVDALSPLVFAENPLLLELNQTHYVRAIADATDTHGLSFMAAIDEGLIMTLGEGQEIMQTLDMGLGVRNRREEPPDFILGFDCVLRKLEIEQKDLQDPVSEILSRRRVLGFNTFGEQCFGLHMNQTFVGVAFFAPDRRVIF